MVNGVGAGNYRRIAHHPLEDRYHPTQRPLCLCRDGKEEMGREVLASARPGRPPIGFAGTHFLSTTGSPVRATRLSAWPATLVFLPSLGTRGGTGLQRLSSLDC